MTFVALTVILDRQGNKLTLEMPSITTVGYAAMRVLEAMGVDPERPCALADVLTWKLLDPLMLVSEIQGPVVIAWEVR